MTTPVFEGAEDWQPRVIPTGREWLITYECPTCNRPQALNVQAGNWEVPIVYPDEDATGRVRRANETSEEAMRWEVRRAAGEIEHVLESQFTTQLWCHQCQHGADLTLIEQ